jgi:hypothetical protein
MHGKKIPNNKTEAIKNIKNIIKDIKPLNVTLAEIKEEKLRKYTLIK